MKGVKRILFSLLIMAVLFVSIGMSANATGTDASTDQVTRAEWLSKLAETFEMTVEDDNYPDNYFSDLDSESEYYYDILLTVEFGVIDVPAGGEVRPDDPVTREFAVETLNFCLGFELDEDVEYTFSDVDACENPKDVQVALNRGWVELIDGAFSPEVYITSAEMQVMMDDAAAVLAADVVDESYNSTYDFAEGVIEISEDVEAEVSIDETVTIANLEQTIEAGDKFAVYQNGVPGVYEAVTITAEGENTVITTTAVPAEEAFDNIDAQEVTQIDLTQVEAMNGGEIIFIDEETGEEFEDPVALMRAAQARGVTKLKSTIKEKVTFDIQEGLSVEAELTLKDAAVYHGINYGDKKVYAYLDCTAEISYKIVGDLAKAAGLDEILIMTVGVPGVGGLSFYVDLEASGSVTCVNAYYLKSGVSFSLDDGFRQIKTFKNKKFSIVAEAAVAAGISARLGVTDLPVIDAYVFAKGGAKASVTNTAYEAGSVPANCVHFAAYVYASYGAEASVDFPFLPEYTKTIESVVYDDSNSPYRIVHHYEDGVEVPACTCGVGDANGYYTNSSSIFSGSGWGGGTNSKGLNDVGEPVAIYSYTVDDAGNATITNYMGNASALVIPEKIDGYPVTAIGARAFEECMNIRSVVIPDAVTWIGLGAFAECWALESVTLPDSLETIGTAAFINCYNLENVVIPKSLKYFRSGGVGTGYHEEGVFHGCSSLRVVVLEEGTTSIVEKLFSGCTGLKTLTIPDSVTTIEEAAFANCTNLKEINISNNVTTIGVSAFANCTALTDVTIPNGVTIIGARVFEECSSLESVTMADSVTYLDLGAFESCTSLKNVKLSKNLETIGAGAFNNCTALESIEIPKSLTYFREGGVGTGYSLDGVFQNCSSLKNVTFEEGTTKVLKCLFRGCNGLESITIPDTVTVIEIYALSKCVNLEDVNISDSVTTIGKEAFEGCIDLVSINIPGGVTAIEARAFADCSKLEKVTMADNVLTMAVGVFDSCVSLTDVKLSQNLTTIGAGVFNECDVLVSIELPKSLVNFREGGVGTGYSLDGVFQGCDSLKNVTFEEGTTKILKCLFNGCTGLESIVVPDTATVIEQYAFQGCTALTNVTIPESVTTIGKNAFRGCSTLKGITIPQSVTSLGVDAFYECVNLKKIELSDAITVINERTFYGCSALTAVELPAELTTVGSSAFENSGLEKLVIPENVTKIESNAFKNCDELTEVTMGTNLKTIAYGAFYDCDALENVALNNNLTTIGDRVFYDCDALKEFIIPYSVTEIGSYMLAECDLLETVTFGTGLTTIPDYAFYQCQKLNNIVLSYRVTVIKDYAFANNVGLTAITIPRATTEIGDNVFSYPSQLTIYGISGTYAEEYAQAKGITFVNHEINATDVVLNHATLELGRGAEETLKMTVTPANFTDVVTWETTDESIVTVDENGVVRAEAVGEATVKVTVGSVSARCKITVVQPVEDIWLNTGNVSIDAGETYQLTATVEPYEANNKEVVWSTSDEDVASVDQTGLVTAHAKGTAIITAAAQDGNNVSATCEITVNNNGCFAETAEELESTHDYENNSTDFWVYTVEGAEALKVTFDEQTEVEEDFDFLYIYDAEGSEVGKYTGTELAGTTITVPGDTVKIQFDTGASGTAWGFKVTSVTEAALECEHEYGEWEQYDADQHMRTCECGDAQYETHNFSEWIIVVEPTTTDTGMEERSCEVCGYEETREIEKLDPVEPENPFTDVIEGRYYYNPVMWAVANGITNGMTPTTFAPDNSCTRAQIVTFLWRAYGSPEPTSTECPFTDVVPGSFYEKAVLWAVEKEITSGMTPTTFEPGKVCTREQTVTFLWRAEGKPMPASSENPFTDIDAKGFAYNAILWAVEKGITNGMTDTTFAPKNECTRGQVVTFLYRTVN